MAYQQLLRDWNKGVLALEKGNLDAALDIFRGIKNPPSKINFNIGCLHEEALNNGKLALGFLRNNSCINYKQLGLAFVLCASEVLHNMAATHCQLGRWHEAREALEEAARQMPQRRTVIALKRVEDHLFLEPQTVPPGKIFRPPLQAEELKEKDYLGQSKVISSAFEEDLSIDPPQLKPQEWLEGRCNGMTGIFPKRFAEPECPVDTRL
ncbi:hypothetical protein E2320_006695 [Naja naja]|nr:hypothetical protein E2320_006695 [Naja naja]